MAKMTPFNLVRTFSLISLICILLVAVTASLLLSRFLTNRMLQRDAELTMESVQVMAQVENVFDYFRGRRLADKGFEEFLSGIALKADVLRTNIYSRDSKLIWSSDSQLTGQKLDRNEELEDALTGELKFETGTVGRENHPKAEHMFLGRQSVNFVENYFPVRDPGNNAVVGVVEVYRIPNALFDAIQAGTGLIWLSMIGGGLFLYVSLYWVVHRASVIMREQQGRLVESETLSAIGEMSGAIAHSIRNPLASIRSSAELMQTEAHGAVHENAKDIVDEVDRLEGWLRDLLTFSQPKHGLAEPMLLAPLLRESVEPYEREMEKRGIRPRLNVDDVLPPVKVDSGLLSQALRSLLSNAIEAMPNGGELVLTGRWDRHANRVRIAISDTGVGIPANQIEKVFLPFHTNKPKGLGVGLPLVKRVAKRFGGVVELASEVGLGTTVTLTLPAAR